MCVKQHIYAVLAAQRRRLGLSQQDLAARAALRREKISRLESKGESIGLDELSRLLDAVGLELAVKEKEAQPAPAASSLSAAPRSLPPRDFRKASFVDGSKARILSWGKLPK
jgi:transcriptional regulator with XRE-family HTH domain